MESRTDEQGRANELANQVHSFLADYLDTVSFVLDRALFLERIERLAALIVFWGTRINLTAASGDPGEIAFHIIDSLAPITFSRNEEFLRDAFRAGNRVIDVGSGAGFPGLVLAAASPATFTLLESRRKRASFLAVAAAEMGLRNVIVESKRMEPGRASSSRSWADARATTPWPPPGQKEESERRDPLCALPQSKERGGRGPAKACGNFDVVTAKAFARPSVFHSIAASALRLGGLAVLYANPGQDLAHQNAEKNGLHEFRRVAYTIPTRNHPVERILGLWRRR
jgi:16S rRNA G527 N7-methylase RsmG